MRLADQYTFWCPLEALDLWRLYAFEDRCTHDGESLAGAEVEPGADAPVVVCPRHGARFCLQHGAALTPPAYEPIRIFAVRERAGRIEVRPAGA